MSLPPLPDLISFDVVSWSYFWPFLVSFGETRRGLPVYNNAYARIKVMDVTHLTSLTGVTVWKAYTPPIPQPHCMCHCQVTGKV